MSVSPPDYIGIWKLLYDWQTIIAGGAAIFGGWIAYRAGVKQAQATRESTDKQLAAAAAEIANSNAAAIKQRLEREVAKINIAISAMGYNIETLHHFVSQHILPHYKESCAAYEALRKADDDREKIAQLAMSLSTYRALVTICPDMHLIEWDFFEEMPFVVEKYPELLKQTGWLISQSRTLAAAIQNRNRNIISAMQATNQQGGLKTHELRSILHLQMSIAVAECLTSIQLLELFLNIQAKLEAINDTYKINARKSKLTAAKPLVDAMNELREIVKATAPYYAGVKSDPRSCGVAHRKDPATDTEPNEPAA